MPAEDVKPWVDMLVALMSAGGGGAILLAFMGWMKAKHERPDHIAPPVPATGMAQQIGGMVMAQSATDGIIAGLNSLAAAHTSHTAWCMTDAKTRQETEDRWHKDFKTLSDHIDTLNDRLKNLPGCGA
jgi:hypothetical protein